MSRLVGQLQDLPEESMGPSWPGVTIKRVIHPKLVDSSYLSVNILKISSGHGTPTISTINLKRLGEFGKAKE